MPTVDPERQRAQRQPESPADGGPPPKQARRGQLTPAEIQARERKKDEKGQNRGEGGRIGPIIRW